MLSERAPTGIPGLDDMLEGGIPRGRPILVVGGPGTGKTILCAQFLVNGFNMYDEPGIFVSLEASKTHIYQEMRRFKWDLQKLEKDGRFHFIDASPIRHAPAETKIGKMVVGKREFSMLSLINAIDTIAKSTNASRIVVDPVVSLIFQYADPYERRTAFLDLLEAVTATGATSIMTMESKTIGLEGDVLEEEYVTHGVVVMQRLNIGKTLSRVIQVRKMRMTAADDQPRPYRIDNSGITVFSKETVF